MTTADPLLQGRYTREQLFAGFFKRPTWWLREHIGRYDGDPQALLDSMVGVFPKQSSDLHRAFLALSLMWLGREEGSVAVRSILQGGDDDARLFVLDELRRFPQLRRDAQGRIEGTTLAFDDVAADLAPLLADPARVGSEFARELCIRHAFAAARPALAALRSHAQWPIARQVLDAYRQNDLEEGTLGLFERWLGEPGIRSTQADRERLHGLCRLLGEWTLGSRHPFLPAALAKIALSVLQQAMDVHDRAARLQPHASGWLAVESLMDAVAAQRPEGAAWLFKRMAALASLHPLLRARALLHHLALTGKATEQARDILSALWALPGGERIDADLVGCLLDSALLDEAELARALRNPIWAGPLLARRAQWPGQDATATASMLLSALEACAEARPLPSYAMEESLRGLLELADAPQRERACAVLRRLTTDEAAGDGHFDRSLAEWQLRLGDREGVDLARLPPWAAMRLHWQRSGLDWAGIASTFAAAGMIDALSADALAQLPPIASLEIEGDADGEAISDPLLDLFALGGRPMHEAHLVDNGFEHHHDRLFAALAAMLRPPLPVDAVQQSGSMRFDVVNQDASSLAGDGDSSLAQLRGVPVLSTEGSELQVEYRLDGERQQFTVHPRSTWMDDGSVLDALNALLAARGHSERIHSLHHWASWGYEGAHYLCAPAQGFEAIAATLRLPLREPARRESAPAGLLLMGNTSAAPAAAGYLYDWSLHFRV